MAQHHPTAPDHVSPSPLKPEEPEYDRRANAAYVYFTDEPLTPGRDSVPLETPEGVQAFIVLDWKDNKIVGLEILDADQHLHRDFLEQAEIIG